MPRNPPSTALGKDVHFVLQDGEHRSAKIVSVQRETVNLTIWLDGYHDRNENLCGAARSNPLLAYAEHVPYSDAHGPNTWHFPEKL